MKILLVYLQPKDIPEVLEPLREIQCDKLFLRYIQYPDVYRVAHKFIKDHSEYTHIFWLQNDIILTLKDFENCIWKLLKNNLRILGLSMNVDLENPNQMAYTMKHFPYKTKNNIQWAKKGEHEGIIEVFHNGGPFLIERSLFLYIPLHGWGKTGYNADIVHGIEFWQSHTKYYLDSEANLKHLRGIGVMQVNKKMPQAELIRV